MQLLMRYVYNLFQVCSLVLITMSLYVMTQILSPRYGLHKAVSMIILLSLLKTTNSAYYNNSVCRHARNICNWTILMKHPGSQDNTVWSIYITWIHMAPCRKVQNFGSLYCILLTETLVRNEMTALITLEMTVKIRGCR